VSVEGRVDRISSWWQRRSSVSWLSEEVYLFRVKLLVYGAWDLLIEQRGARRFAQQVMTGMRSWWYWSKKPGSAYLYDRYLGHRILYLLQREDISSGS
jgi:hypothetical protein